MILKKQRGQRGVLRAAERMADEVALRAGTTGDVDCVEDVVPVVGALTGLEITIEDAILPGDLVGFVEADGVKARVTISPRCVTREHTLAHELGHLVLDHRHGLIAPPPPPPGCGGLWEKIVQEHEDEAERNEAAAEAFATRLLLMLPLRGETVASIPWKVALG